MKADYTLFLAGLINEQGEPMAPPSGLGGPASPTPPPPPPPEGGDEGGGDEGDESKELTDAQVGLEGTTLTIKVGEGGECTIDLEPDQAEELKNLLNKPSPDQGEDAMSAGGPMGAGGSGPGGPMGGLGGMAPPM